MPDAFIFQADTWCGGCIVQLIFDRDWLEPDYDRSNHNPADVLESMRNEFGFTSESDYDSSQYPKGPFADGGGEADSPQNCCSCGAFLENELTSDGYAYVLEQLQNARGSDCSALAEWLMHYADGYMGKRTLGEKISVPANFYQMSKNDVAAWIAARAATKR